MSKLISLHTTLELNNKQQDRLFFSTPLTALLYAATEYWINAERSWAMSWAGEELHTIDLGDKRLNEREYV